MEHEAWERKALYKVEGGKYDLVVEVMNSTEGRTSVNIRSANGRFFIPVEAVALLELRVALEKAIAYIAGLEQ